jgi:uncharacterized protein (TIGR00730 family)
MSAGTGRTIAVFGSSEPDEGEPLYVQAMELGALLALAGYRVATGGYGGVMEAASRGAAEAGGATVGVTCSVFSERTPNRWLRQRVDAPDLHERMRRLVEISDGYIVLHGKSGTLAELTLLWALHRAGCLDRRPVLLLGDGWRHLLRHLVRAGMIESPQFEITRVVDAPAEAVDALATFWEG